MGEPKTCIYPGCGRPAVPANPLGGPQPAFCDLEDHNALTVHQELRRLEDRSVPDTRPETSQRPGGGDDD
jgi:hypothetical protein